MAESASIIVTHGNGDDSWTSPSTIEHLVSALIWPVFIIVLFILFKKQIADIFNLLKSRLRAGAAVKLGSFEISGSQIPRTLPPGASWADELGPGVFLDESSFKEVSNHRNLAYEKSKNIVLVHRIWKSIDPKELFDIEIYCTPHRVGTLLSVKSVSYYFGSYWKERVFRSDSRYNGFAVRTSAYGPFLCVAKLTFVDGGEAIVSRYIDFEMGAFAPAMEPSNDE